MNTEGSDLLRAAHRGDITAVSTAIRAGAPLEVTDDHRRTPLLLAALADHVDVARALVASGADPNAQDDRRDSAWLVTGATGSVAMMRTLLPAGPDLKRTNRFGGTALIPACERGHTAYVRAVLQETEMDVDHVNQLGWTALLEAVILGDGSPPYEEIVGLLLTAGATPDLPDSEGRTPLEHAEHRGFASLAALLREAGG